MGLSDSLDIMISMYNPGTSRSKASLSGVSADTPLVPELSVRTDSYVADCCLANVRYSKLQLAFTLVICCPLFEHDGWPII